ncbi:MAG: branched-chain amino acid transferase [Deltaproteobacteria bacterium]|nr:branched-chain amino acid transferase [Deltaproteobacteria bacterium]
MMTEENPYQSGIAYTDGSFCPIEEARIPILDWGFLRSDANQDTVSVWNGMFFRLEDHLDRFQRNNEKLRFKIPLSRDEIRTVLIDLVQESGFQNAYVQMLMTRGRPPIGVRDLRMCENRFHAFCLPYIWLAPEEVRHRGLHAHISPIQRISSHSVDPTIKHYHWLDFQMGLFEAYDSGAETVILTDSEGNITEGPGFNVFMVEKNSLFTPASGVLEGMTRRTVFELCELEGIRSVETSISPERLHSAEEVFLSSTAGGLIPVTQLDGLSIGSGKPGETTLLLNQSYWKRRLEGWHATKIHDEEP